jgi:transcriptional regulator with XRE-family HTH domain
MSNSASLLRSARRSAGLTQTELADRLGASQAAVARLESARANPTVNTLEQALWATGHRLTLQAPARGPGVDESLIRRQLERAPAERIRGIESMYAEAQKLAAAGARSRGERG